MLFTPGVVGDQLGLDYLAFGVGHQPRGSRARSVYEIALPRPRRVAAQAAVGGSRQAHSLDTPVTHRAFPHRGRIAMGESLTPATDNTLGKGGSPGLCSSERDHRASSGGGVAHASGGRGGDVGPTEPVKP